MFDVGFSEIFVIAVVALVVLGPERLPKAARFAGLWVRRARAQWHSVKSELENEIADEELRRSLRATAADVQRTGQHWQESAQQWQQDLGRLGASAGDLRARSTQHHDASSDGSSDASPDARPDAGPGLAPMRESISGDLGVRRAGAPSGGQPAPAGSHDPAASVHHDPSGIVPSAPTPDADAPR